MVVDYCLALFASWGDTVAQSWRMGGDHTGIWSSTKQVVQWTAAIPANYSGRPFGWNDMDMLETGMCLRARMRVVLLLCACMCVRACVRACTL
jgi:hypothetical protein